jgi:hypothetical protein
LSQLGLFRQQAARFNDRFDAAFPSVIGNLSQPVMALFHSWERFLGNALQTVSGMIPIHNVSGVWKVASLAGKYLTTFACTRDSPLCPLPTLHVI